MGKAGRWGSILLLTVLLFTGISPRVRAADASVTFRGKEKTVRFAPGSGYSRTDLFPNFKDCMPGDVLTQKVTIRNTSPDADSLRIYLRAEPHSNENPPVTGEAMADMSDFLSQLTLRIWQGEKLLYEDSPEDPGSIRKNVYLATLKRHEKITLRMELEIPVSLGNRYADRVGEVDWVFTAEAFDAPESPDSPKTGDIIGLTVLTMLLSGSGLILLWRKKQ